MVSERHSIDGFLFQALCKVLDAHYDIGEVLKVSVGSDDDHQRIYFVIDTEVKK